MDLSDAEGLHVHHASQPPAPLAQESCPLSLPSPTCPIDGVVYLGVDPTSIPEPRGSVRWADQDDVSKPEVKQNFVDLKVSLFDNFLFVLGGAR